MNLKRRHTHINNVSEFLRKNLEKVKKNLKTLERNLKKKSGEILKKKLKTF